MHAGLYPSATKRRSRTESDAVSAAFQEFQPLAHPILRLVSPSLPIVALAMLDIGLWRNDQMYASGMACVAIEMIIFQVLLERLPETFHTLWIEDVIEHRVAVAIADGQLAQGMERSEYVSPAKQGEARMILFMGRLEKRLNGHAQWVSGGLICTIPLIWRWITYNNNHKFLTVCPFDYLVKNLIVARAIGLMALAGESVIAIFVGLLLWRLLVIGVTISNSCRELGLIPRPRHPDRCGGFKPLGHLCLIMAFVHTIPGVFLAMWVLFPTIAVVAKYHGWYTTLFEPLLIGSIVGAIVNFILPLWNVHKVIVRESNLRRQDLDRLGQRISDLEVNILKRSGEGTGDDCEKMQKSVDFLRSVYEDNQRLPTWPCDVRTTTAFLLSQAIPAITLIESLCKFAGVGHG